MRREDFKLSEEIKPGEDFYQYTNKFWIDNNPMPSDRSRYASFDKLHEENLERLMELVDKPSASLPISLQANIKDLRDKYLERDYAENYKFVENEFFQKAKDAKMFKDLLELHARMIPSGVRFLLNVYIDADLKDCDNNIIYVSQDGLSINRDYYEDEKIFSALTNYVTRTFKRVSNEYLETKVQNVLNIEKKLSYVSSTETQMRDTEMSYNIYRYSDLLNDFSEIPWAIIFKSNGITGVTDDDKICINQPDFVRGLNELLFDYRTMVGGSIYYRAYLVYCIADSFAPHLGVGMWKDYFDFYFKTLKGQDMPESLEKRAFYFTQSVFPDAIGKKYIENYFSDSKAEVEKLVNSLIETYSERIQKQTWMSQNTKDLALKKLGTFKTKIGYPEKLDEYEWISFNKYDCFLKIKTEITKQAILHESEKKFRKPVDKDEWYMSPQVVNAYYNPTTNEICFPAGILQFPFYSSEVSVAWNYGGIGAVIGHEMTHGFDDQGRLFDKDGNMENWWEDEDSRRFKEITDKFVKYWNNLEVLPGLNANGELSLGENLADHGGVRIALEAFKKLNPTKDDIREFFISYSANWAGSIKEEEIRRRTIEDEHSLGEKRVNACLQHFDEWYEAFSIKEGDPMFIKKEDRLSIW